MGYHPRIESSDLGSFITTRCRAGELWFVNNQGLERSILGYAAKFAERYDVSIYALAIQGNHIQLPALFPEANRADFMRDFNSAVARSVSRLTPEYPGGRLWARRYSQEFLPGAGDIEEYFWYTVLQPIQDGLVERLSDYPAYNCFHDAINGIQRKFKIVRWAAYNAAKRYNPDVKRTDYIETVTLRYERLPGYEHLSQREYARLMRERLEERRQAIVKQRYASGRGFAGKRALLTTQRGARPVSSKSSDRRSHRPRILSVCNERRAEYKSWYFSIYFDYKDASARYRRGERNVTFPPGTYPPWRPVLPVLN